MSDIDPIAELDRLLDKAGLRVTFDAERSISKPCFDCGRSDVPRGLVDIGWDEQRQMKITRPFCPEHGAVREALNSARREGKAEGLREAARILRNAAEADARNAVHCSAPNHRERLQNLSENELVMAQRMLSRAEEVERDG